MKVLAFGAHPDDIEIGVGGTIARHSNQGDEVLMVVACIPGERNRRIEESKTAAGILGAKLHLVELETDRLVHRREVIEQFDKIVADFTPDVVYTHWNHDSHQDHTAVSDISITVGRKNNYSMFMYEQCLPGGVVPFSFTAQSYCDISDFIGIKRDALAAHASQLEANGPRWIEALDARATYRGYQIGVMHAEAFEVVKQVNSLFS